MQSIADDVNKLITGNLSTMDVYVELPKNRFDKLRGQVYKITDGDLHKYASLFIAESKTDQALMAWVARGNKIEDLPIKVQKKV